MFWFDFYVYIKPLFEVLANATVVATFVIVFIKYLKMKREERNKAMDSFFNNRGRVFELIEKRLRLIEEAICRGLNVHHDRLRNFFLIIYKNMNKDKNKFRKIAADILGKDVVCFEYMSPDEIFESLSYEEAWKIYWYCREKGLLKKQGELL